MRQIISQEEIDAACAEAIEAYERYEHKRVFTVLGWTAGVCTAILIALLILHP